MTEEGAPAPAEQAPDKKENRCAACGNVIPRAGYFCPNCGTPVPGAPPPYALHPRTWTGQPVYFERPRSSTRAVFKAIAGVLIISFAAVLIIELVTLIYGASLVGPDILDSGWRYPLFVITPVLVRFASLSGYTLLGYYLFLVGAIVVSVAWVLLTSMKGFRAELEMKAKPREHSALFDAGALMFATIFFSIVTALLLGGSSPAPSSGNTLSQSLLTFASASVWEELVTRVLLIGVPLLIIHIVIKKRQALHKYLLGAGFKLGVPEAALIILSGAMFGVAHYDGGWGAWKIIPATVAGFAFGYLFLRHGLPAAIVVHFGTDYLSMPSDVFNSTGLLGVLGITELIWAGAGAVFFVYFVIRILEYLSRTELFAEKARPQVAAQWGYWTYPQQPTPYGPLPQVQTPTTPVRTPEQHVSYAVPIGHGFGAGYICPACGGREARWIDGRFQCLTCGRLS